MTVSIERLRSLLSYDPATGIFRWKVSRSRSPAGAIAGHRRPVGSLYAGEVIIGIDGKYYRANRLAFAIMSGKWPVAMIDHRDCDYSNNRWDNLREATLLQNCQNQRTHRDSSTGLKGVYKEKGNLRRPYRAKIKVGDKQISLGFYATPEEAHAAYMEAAIKNFGEFARAA